MPNCWPYQIHMSIKKTGHCHILVSPLYLQYLFLSFYHEEDAVLLMWRHAISSHSVHKWWEHVIIKRSLLSDGQQFQQYQQNKRRTNSYLWQRKDHDICCCWQFWSFGVKQWMGSQPSLLDNQISNVNTYINKQ